MDKSKREEVTDSKVDEEEKRREEGSNGNEQKIKKVDRKTEKDEKKTKQVKELSHRERATQQEQTLWMRKGGGFKEQEYASFCTSLSNDWEDHLSGKYFSVEGQLEFHALHFVIRRAPFDVFETKKKRNNITLYFRRALSMDDCDELIPEWLNFMKGTVVSEGLPLNISRETLQQNMILREIKKNLVKKCLDKFAQIAEKSDDFKKCHAQCGKCLKLGSHEHSTTRTKVARLMVRRRADECEGVS